MTGVRAKYRGRGLKNWAGRPLRNLAAGRPVLAIFEINLTCNSACPYCHLPLNQGRYEMTAAEIARVFSGLYADGLRHVFVQGGEPLVRADLVPVLDELAAIGFSLSLITNGTRFTPELVARLAALPLAISVSLDSLDREIYRRLRGADQLPRVLAGIALLADFPGAKYLTTIVSAANLDCVMDVVRFARAEGFQPVIGAYHWRVMGYGNPVDDLKPSRAASARVFDELLQSGLIPAGYLRNYLRDNLDWLAGAGLPACDAGRYSIAIDAGGNVSPCLPHAAAGNLLKESLTAILAKIDRKAVDQCSARSTCNLLCARVVGANLRHPVAAIVSARQTRNIQMARG